MKKTILFLDNTYPTSYQSSTLLENALGGTEASVIRTAKILSTKFNVLVAQQFRESVTKESSNLSFIPKSEIHQHIPSFIIVLRKYPLLKELKKTFPKAKLFLWLHTYKNYEFIFKRFGLSRLKATIICNSRTHKQHISQLISKGVINKLLSVFIDPPPVGYCYNPIPNPKKFLKEEFYRDRNKLLFFSSPNKGLDQTINCFKELLRDNQNLKLYIANPGYKIDAIKLDAQIKNSVVVLGSLKHEEMMKHVSESLCVFYPQDTFAETFGLIYAEANAYRTPVLAHDIGSAKEILHKNNHLVNVNDYAQIWQAIVSWQKKLPSVSYNKNFSDDSVFNQWRKLFKED